MLLVNYSLKEYNGQLICLKNDHNEPIITVVMDDSVNLKERLLCYKCLQNRVSQTQVMGVEPAKEKFKEVLRKANESKVRAYKNTKDNLNQLLGNLLKIQEITKKIQNDSLNLLNQWVQETELKETQDHIVCLLQEIEKINRTRNTIIMEENKLSQINQKYGDQMSSLLQQIVNMVEITNCQNIIKQIKPPQLQTILSNQSFPKTVQFNNQIIDQVQNLESVVSVEKCQAIAFNSSSDVMVSGCLNNIKVWNLNQGKITEKQQLQGHSGEITCLLFSKKSQWFISGSTDCSIQSWKQQQQFWVNSSSGKQHTGDVISLIFNIQEDQIISCSSDQRILVWKANFSQNTINFDYELEQRHTKGIFSISLNQSNTSLVSCSFDRNIILWKKDFNSKWIFKSNLLTEDFGCRISFINDFEVAWQQYSKGITHIFQIINGDKLVSKSIIKLDKEQNDVSLFPTIVNQNKKIMIQKHNKFVSILSINFGAVNLVKQLDCCDSNNFGALTPNGEYLIIWIFKLKEFAIYKISYKNS